MSVINIADYQELTQIIADANKLVSGLSPAEAAKALQLNNYEVITGAPYILNKAPEIIKLTDATAQEAYLAYGAAGGALSAAGAATIGTATTASLTAIAAGGGAIGVAGLVSLAPPVAIAVGLAVLGYSAGQLAYQADPEFWNNLYRSIKTFFYPDTEVVPAVCSGETIYIDKALVDRIKSMVRQYQPYTENREAVDTIKQYFPNGIEVTNSNTTIRYTASGDIYDKATFSENVQISRFLTGSNSEGIPYESWIAASTSPFTCKVTQFDSNGDILSDEDVEVYSKAINGIRTYFRTGIALSLTSLTNSFPIVQRGTKFSDDTEWVLHIDDIIKSILFGNATTYVRPNGLDINISAIPENYDRLSIDVVTSVSDGNIETSPFIPVTLPSEFPWMTPTTINPQQPTPPDVISPTIPPEVSPGNFPPEFPATGNTTAPVPDESKTPSPDLDPNADPSQEPAKSPNPSDEPTRPIPTSDGDSPLVPFPPEDFPTIVSAGSGLIHVYNPTPAEMIAFGKWLWVTMQEGGFTIGSYQRLWNNPFDGVIGAFELYATPVVNGRDSIRSGFLSCPTTANLVPVRYFNVDCGSIVVPEYYGNYLDYSPYTKAHIYLPFVGIVELNCDDIIGHGVNVTYRIDAYNGSCIATITVAKDKYNALMYQYSGNCGVELPLAGGSQAAIKAGLIGAAATGVASVIQGVAGLVTGNIGMVGSAVGGLGNAAARAVSNKSSVQHSGAFGDSCGAMGNKKPYLIIHRPIQKYIANYNQIYGFPAHTLVIIGDCTGFLRALEVHVESSQATDEEKARIEQMLKEGVIVS